MRCKQLNFSFPHQTNLSKRNLTMANITIGELCAIETEFSELSDLEIESILGGKERSVDAGYSQEQGWHAGVSITF